MRGRQLEHRAQVLEIARHETGQGGLVRQQEALTGRCKSGWRASCRTPGRTRPHLRGGLSYNPTVVAAHVGLGDGTLPAGEEQLGRSFGLVAAFGGCLRHVAGDGADF